MNTENPVESVRILKIETCPSLSGKSTLTYHLGCNTESEIQLRLHANSGKGFFSKTWTPLSSIQELLAKLPEGRAVTSATFIPIFHGKSVNTSGFLLAVLKHEGLVQVMKDKRRSYESLDPQVFMAEVAALLASPIELSTTDLPGRASSGKKVSLKAKQKATVHTAS